MNQVNVLNFGAKGDGVTDNSSAFQAAEDSFKGGLGTVYAPTGIYNVSKPFYHRNFVTLKGDGDSTVIRNQVAVKGIGDEQFCIHIGNFLPTTFGECVHYDVQDIKANSTQIILIDKSNVKSFKSGDIILIDTIDGFTDAKGKFKPYQAFINRVKDVSTTGMITLEDAVSADVFHAKVASTNKFTVNNNLDKIYICQNPVIQNIRFESLGDWTMRFGVYKGWFENISLKTTDAIGGNGFSHCTFKNIRAEFSQKVIEMATYSHDTLVDGLTATWWAGAVDTDMKPLLKMGENVRGCTYTNMNLYSGAGKYFGMVMRFEHAFNNKIFANHFECQTVAQNAVEFTTTDPAAIVVGNEVRDNTFSLGNIGAFIKFDTGGTAANVTGNTVTGNTFKGIANKQIIGGENNIVENNLFS